MQKRDKHAEASLLTVGIVSVSTKLRSKTHTNMVWVFKCNQVDIYLHWLPFRRGNSGGRGEVFCSLVASDVSSTVKFVPIGTALRNRWCKRKYSGGLMPQRCLPYSCMLLREIICCWSIPAANYSNPLANSTCIWELEEAGEWGTEGSGLCLTVCLVKYWYYLVSFPAIPQYMMQGEPQPLWSFIALTVLFVRHASICPLILTFTQFTPLREFTKTQGQDPCPQKPILYFCGSVLSPWKANQRRNTDHHLCSFQMGK